MRILIAVWNDISAGKNIEFYSAVLFAFLACGASAFGVIDSPIGNAIALAW